MPNFSSGMMDIRDLFANLSNNWEMSELVYYLLFGILLASYVAIKIKKRLKGGDD